MVRALLLVVLLSGCAHAPPTDREIAYGKALKAWVGQDINRAFEMMGPPAETFQMPDGRKMYTWRVSGTETTRHFNAQSHDATKRCKTTFTATSDGIVSAVRSEGRCGVGS